MKKLLFIILILAFASKAQAQIVEKYSTSTLSVFTVSPTTMAFNASSSDLGVIIVQVGTPGRTITVGDNQGNTWILGTTTTSSNNTGVIQPTCALYYLPNLPGGNMIASSTVSGASATSRLFYLEYSGVKLSSPLDAIISSSTPANQTVVQTNLLTTQGLNELHLMAACSPLVNAFTFSNGFTARETGGRGSVGDLIVASSSISGAGTFGSAVAWDTFLVSFLPLVITPSPTSDIDLEVQAFLNGFLSI